MLEAIVWPLNPWQVKLPMQQMLVTLVGHKYGGQFWTKYNFLHITFMYLCASIRADQGRSVQISTLVQIHADFCISVHISAGYCIGTDQCRSMQTSVDS